MRRHGSGQVAFTAPLRGVISNCDKAAADAAAIGGLRQCADAVDRLPRARSANHVLRTMVDRFLDAFPWRR